MTVRIGVVSVGGRGSRFGDIGIQKCLIPLEGKPLLEYPTSLLEELGMTLIIYLTGHHHGQIDSYISSLQREKGSTLAMVYGGTDGEMSALLKLQAFLKEDFLYAAGDCVLDTRIVRRLLQDAERNQDADMILSASRLLEGAPDHARIRLKKKSCFVKSVSRADESNAPLIVATGLVYFRSSVFKLLERIGSNKARYVADLLHAAQSCNKEIPASLSNDPWFCVHSPGDLEKWRVSKMRKRLMQFGRP